MGVYKIPPNRYAPIGEKRRGRLSSAALTFGLLFLAGSALGAVFVKREFDDRAAYRQKQINAIVSQHTSAYPSELEEKILPEREKFILDCLYNNGDKGRLITDRREIIARTAPYNFDWREEWTCTGTNLPGKNTPAFKKREPYSGSGEP